MGLGSPVRVNVGCGASPTAGWVNYDNSWTVRLAHLPMVGGLLAQAALLSPDQRAFVSRARAVGIRWADVTIRIPHGDCSVEVLYSSHMFEHLDQEAGMRFLYEARRVLVPGGVLRLAVPDIARIVDAYLTTHDADAFIAGTHLTRPAPKTIRQKVTWLIVGDRHHAWMYDGPSLVARLTEAGFRDAQELRPGATLIQKPGALNLREREEESVYIEAIRP